MSTPPSTERRRGERRRRIRLAAVGDLHYGADDSGRYRDLLHRAAAEADALLLAGDLTRRGRPEEMQALVSDLAGIDRPVLAVLGNHDYEADRVEELRQLLRERGVHVLDGEDPVELPGGVGVAGAKGFIGGFGARTLTAFGEPEIKAIVQASIAEAHKLEFALRRLATPVRVVLLHYAPVVDTVRGEPEEIYAFLGTDRLAEPIDRYGAAVVFHGHAHNGAVEGRTPGGVPVFNVALPLLERVGWSTPYVVWDAPLSPLLEEAS